MPQPDVLTTLVEKLIPFQVYFPGKYNHEDNAEKELLFVVTVDGPLTADAIRVMADLGASQDGKGSFQILTQYIPKQGKKGSS